MVEIGGRPILWHIMKIYAAHGVNEFVVCLRLQGLCHQGMVPAHLPRFLGRDLLHLATNEMVLHRAAAEPWRVTLVDTGEETRLAGASSGSYTM